MMWEKKRHRSRENTNLFFSFLHILRSSQQPKQNRGFVVTKHNRCDEIAAAVVVVVIVVGGVVGGVDFCSSGFWFLLCKKMIHM